MIGIIVWFFVASFFYGILNCLYGKAQVVIINLWPCDKQKTQKVFYRIFIGFLIYATFAAFLSAILDILGIDV